MTLNENTREITSHLQASKYLNARHIALFLAAAGGVTYAETVRSSTVCAQVGARALPVAQEPLTRFQPIPAWLDLEGMLPHDRALLGMHNAGIELVGQIDSEPTTDEIIARAHEYIEQSYSDVLGAENPDKNRVLYIMRHPAIAVRDDPVEDQECSTRINVHDEGAFLRVSTYFSESALRSTDEIWWTPEKAIVIEGQMDPSLGQEAHIQRHWAAPLRMFPGGTSFVSDEALWRAAVLLDHRPGRHKGETVAEKPAADEASIPAAFEWTWTAEFPPTNESSEADWSAYRKLRQWDLLPLNGAGYLPTTVRCHLHRVDAKSWLWEEDWIDTAGGARLFYICIEGDNQGPRHIAYSKYTLGTDFQRVKVDITLTPTELPKWEMFQPGPDMKVHDYWD